MIKRSPSLTDQAKSHIKQQILSNAYAEDRIPSETDLANELRVSRTTVRDALSRLESEGVVYRKQGAGTFVNRPGLQIKSRLDEIWSYEAMLRAHGYEPSTRVLEVDRKAAPPEVAALLSLRDDQQVLVVRKLFLEDQQPVILTCNYIPADLVRKPYKTADLELPVFEFLAEFTGRQLGYYLSEIVPLAANRDIADSLHWPPGAALVSLEEVGYSDENEPIVRACSYLRDDLLRLRLIRRKI